MTQTVFDPVATELKAVIEGMSLSPVVKVYKWLPRQFSGAGPFAIIELPDYVGVEPEGVQTQMGTWDWEMTFPVTFYFGHLDTVNAQAASVEYLESFIKAIHANQSLNGVADEASVVEAKALYLTDDSRSWVAYETQVRVIRYDSN